MMVSISGRWLSFQDVSLPDACRVGFSETERIKVLINAVLMFHNSFAPASNAPTYTGK